jgi:hypothetical protein
MPIYKDDRNVITPLFDQIRRITETEDAMTFERATESLLNITPGGGLPSAEAGSFGVASGFEYGITSSTAYTSVLSKRSVGWQFKAKEAISILGVRYYENFSLDYPRRVQLWDSSGNLLNWEACNAETVGEWSPIVYFNTPVNMAIGETYTISVILMNANASVGNYIAKKSTVTFSSKISFIQAVYNPTNGNTGFPSTQYYTSDNPVPLVDIIIGPVATELPDDYQVQRTTLDDIAVEVQRISGTTSKMTPAQMLTALKAIATE